MNHMGIDHHKQYSHITLLDEKGGVVKSGRVVNLRRELEKFLKGIGNVKAVIEAGRSSYTMVDVLDDMGVETTVAHPKDVKAIAKAKIKTDERDAYKLAQQREDVRLEVARVENLFTAKGMKVLTGLSLPEREAKMVRALLQTYRHLQERICRDLYYRKRISYFLNTTGRYSGRHSAITALVDG